MFCLSKFCYLCLTNSRTLETVEPKSREMILFVRKLRACAIDIVHLKNYTLKVCKTCSDILNVSYEFRKRCLGTNKKLLTYVKTLSNKTARYCESYVILNKKIDYDISDDESSLEYQDGDRTPTPSIDEENGEISSNMLVHQPVVKLERLNDNFIKLCTNKSLAIITETVLPTENGRLNNITKPVINNNNNNKKIRINSFEIDNQQPSNNKNKVKIILSELHPLLKDLYIDRTLTCENNPNKVIQTCLQIKQIEENRNISLKEKLLNELKIAEENTENYQDINTDINLEEKNKNSQFEVDIIVSKQEPVEIHIEDDPLFEFPEEIEQETCYDLQDHNYTYCPVEDNTCNVKLDHPYFNTNLIENNRKRKRKIENEKQRKKPKEDCIIIDDDDLIHDGIVDFSW